MNQRIFDKSKHRIAQGASKQAGSEGGKCKVGAKGGESTEVASDTRKGFVVTTFAGLAGCNFSTASRQPASGSGCDGPIAVRGSRR
jgi:hypothetical protein